MGRVSRNEPRPLDAREKGDAALFAVRFLPRFQVCRGWQNQHPLDGFAEVAAEVLEVTGQQNRKRGRGCSVENPTFPNPRQGLGHLIVMSFTSKSPVAVAREALYAAERSLPLYAHKYSPRKFTQPQLFACLVLKTFFKGQKEDAAHSLK